VAGKGKTKAGKSGDEQVARAELRRQAIELRRSGAGYEDIARHLGMSGPGQAYKVVQEALKATYREPADEVRKLELDRLDRLTLALWQRAKGGESEAIDRVLKLMDRRARLLGLDAPQKFDPGTMPLAVNVIRPDAAHPDG
jgi:transposase-like protein